MNMDYSKVFELLNQDAEKERNKKTEKAVHDNLYNKGFREGVAILDKIRAEIKALSPKPTAFDVVDGNPIKDAKWETIADVLKIIDKYKAESEDKE